jgi:CheY-like chemotaxis protein
MARVLLVDDDPDQLEMRRMLFQQAGHQVYTAVDAGTALEVFGRAAPQLVVTDLRLPTAEDGLALIRTLRQRATAVRIVVLSGWTSDLQHLPETGLVDAIIGKPARTSGLLALAAKLTMWIFTALQCLAPGASAAGMVANLEITSRRMERLELSLHGAPTQHVMAYGERLTGNGTPLLQNTVLFTNQDSGPSIRGHRHIEFAGRRIGRDPLLIPVTRNNMASGEATSPARFQLTPRVVDLSASSRELVMGRNPFTYRVAKKELGREGKLRPFGTVDGEKIGDPRSYLYIEAKTVNRGSAVAALARLKGENRWRGSHLGRSAFAIEREGWVRATVELPPGATPERVASIGFECIVVAPSKGESLPEALECRVEQAGKAFFLGADYRPGASLFQMAKPLNIPAGEMAEFPVR